MGMDVNAKLGVDTAGFDGPMKKSAEVAKATGEAVSKAAKAAADAQALAAKYATTVISQETAKQIESITATREAQSDYYRAQTFVKRGYIDEAAGSQAAAAALQRLTALRLEAAEAAKLQGNAEGAVISKQMAASGTIRLASGQDSIRAVERFISTIPGVGAALQNIFPLIGAAAFAGILFDIGKKIYDVEQKASHAADAIRESFEAEHDKAAVSIDDLSLTNDKLQQQLDKLSGTPNNGVAVALDEARKMADQLVLSLQADRKELEGLLKEHEVGAFGSLLSGVSGTKVQGAEMLADQKKLTDTVRTANEQLDAVQAATTDAKKIKEATDIRNAAVRSAFQAQIDTYQAELSRLKKEETGKSGTSYMDAAAGVNGSYTTDNSAKIANIQGRLQQLQSAKVQEQLQESIFARTAAVGQAKENKASKSSSVDDQAAKDAAASLKFREELRKKVVEDYKRTQALDPKEAEAGIAAFNKWQQKQVESLASNTSRWAEYNAELKRTGVILANNAEAAQRFQIEMAVRTGRMSRPDAARAMAGIHTADSAAKLSALEATLNGLTAALQALDPNSKDYGLKSMALGKQMASTQGQIAEVQGQAQLQAMQDQWAIFSQTAGGGAVTALQEFTSQATDSAAQIKSLIDNTISGLNRTILSTITNPAYMNRGNFENLGKSIFTDISGKALQRGEAGLLSTFGVHAGGKLGSKTNPMYTKSADLATATGGAANPVMSLIHHVFRSGTSAPPGISSSVYPGTGSGSNASSASALGSAAAAVTQSLIASSAGSGSGSGGTSSYTAPPSGVPAIVSSLVGSAVTAAIPFLDSGTNYVPHDTLAMIHQGEAVIPKKYNHPGNLGGTVHNHAWNIDARGSSNPAQTMAMVHQAILAAAPHIAAATKQSIISDNARVAPSARKY